MDVSAWLRGLGLERYTPAFRDNDIGSVCEYVSWKLESPTRMPGVVQKLREWFNLQSEDEHSEIMEKIERFFNAGKLLHRSDWRGYISEDDDSDEGEKDE